MPRIGHVRVVRRLQHGAGQRRGRLHHHRRRRQIGIRIAVRAPLRFRHHLTVLGHHPRQQRVGRRRVRRQRHPAQRLLHPPGVPRRHRQPPPAVGGPRVVIRRIRAVRAQIALAQRGRQRRQHRRRLPRERLQQHPLRFAEHPQPREPRKVRQHMRRIQPLVVGLHPQAGEQLVRHVGKQRPDQGLLHQLGAEILQRPLRDVIRIVARVQPQRQVPAQIVIDRRLGFLIGLVKKGLQHERAHHHADRLAWCAVVVTVQRAEELLIDQRNTPLAKRLRPCLLQPSALAIRHLEGGLPQAALA